MDFSLLLKKKLCLFFSSEPLLWLNIANTCFSVGTFSGLLSNRCKVNWNAASLLASAYYCASRPVMPAGPSWAVQAQLLLSGSVQNYNFPPELVVCRADLCAVVLLWSSSAAARRWACHRDAAALCRAALDVSFHRAPCLLLLLAGAGGGEKGLLLRCVLCWVPAGSAPLLSVGLELHPADPPRPQGGVGSLCSSWALRATDLSWLDLGGSQALLPGLICCCSSACLCPR